MAYKVDLHNRDDRAQPDLANLANLPEADLPETDPIVPKLGRPKPSWTAGWRGLAIGIGIGAAIAVAGTRLIPTQPRPQAPAHSEVAPGQSVTVATAQLSRLAHTTSATGSVAARDLLPILPQASGLQIRQVLAEEGQVVEAGQVLAVLDDSVLQSQITQARSQLVSSQAVIRQKEAQLGQQRATLAEAEANLSRYEGLANVGAVTRQEFESRRTAAATAQEGVNVAEANIASAQADALGFTAQIEKLETQLAQTQVRAPEGGLVAEKLARVGDVTGQNKLFTIIRNGSLELQVKVPENQLAQIRVGSSATVTSDADKRINLQARVREISPLVDPQTRQATVKIDLPTNSLLRSGMFLRAALTVETVQAIAVPAGAVIPQTDGRSIVYALEANDIARARPVEVGSRQAGSSPDQAIVEIKSGLNPGDRMVVTGAGYVKDGDRVTVVK